jgi:chromosome segregation ATPase
LELQLLRQALAASEQEGSSVMDALAAAMDLAAATGGSGSVRSSLDGNAAGAAATADAAAPADEPADAVTELQQLRLQNAVLQQHSQALHSTMHDAAQQLDLLEAKVQQLESEKDAAVADKDGVLQQLECVQQQSEEAAAAALAAEQQHWQARMQHARELHDGELDEQQAQHEEEMGSLLGRLQEAQQQAAAAQQHCQQLWQELQDSEEQCEQLQGEVQDSRAACEAVQQELAALHEALQGSRSDSAADVEQLRRQVASLAAAKAELTAANQALQDAEAGYAAAQMAAGAKGRQLAAQLEVGVTCCWMGWRNGGCMLCAVCYVFIGRWGAESMHMNTGWSLCMCLCLHTGVGWWSLHIHDATSLLADLLRAF